MKKASIKHVFLKYALGKMPERKLFCPIPFKQMEIMSGGDTNLCCYIHKSPGRISSDNIENVYNSLSAQQIRESILDGTFKYCNLDACPHFSGGDLSLQKDCTGSRYGNIVTERLTALDDMNLWLSFDRRCNLRCISCRKDYVKYSEEENAEVERLINVVKNNLSRIKGLGFCGNGEPFASPAMREFLFSLDSSLYPDLKITLLTNGQLFNTRTWESMRKIQRAVKSVQVSIDAATKETYEGLRRGGSFDALMRNLSFISDLRRQNLIGEFMISFVANSRNFMEMDDFVRLGLNLGCDTVYFSAMMDWDILTAEEYKELAVHLPENELHEKFMEKLKDKIFDNPVVMLGNIKRFKPNRFLRNSMFS
jgi:wyosine [tRNA(Phe)-imidazoG37] synthetase (radical SAM superfamily)